MAKYRPVNPFEPSLTSLIYIAGLCCISLSSPTLSLILIILFPIFICFGFVPQIECLVYGIYDSISLYLSLPLNLIQSIVFNSFMIVGFILRPVEALFTFFVFCFLQFKFNNALKTSLQALIIIIGLGICIYFYITNFVRYWEISGILTSEIIHYGILGIGIVFSILEIVFQVINSKKVHKTG